LKLRKHFHDLLSLWTHHRNLNAAKIVPQLSRNVGNINSLLQDALEAQCPDVVQNYQSIIYLNDFFGRTQNTYSPLLKICERNPFWKDSPLFGDYLIQVLEATTYVPLVDAEEKIMLGNKYFEFKQPLEQGKTYFVGLYHFSLIFD
jgi:hypothetical protein